MCSVSLIFFLPWTELQLGELVHHQKLFGLFEAMSAIEMMDPKMDAGMCCNKNLGGPLTFETAIAVSVIALLILKRFYSHTVRINFN